MLIYSKMILKLIIILDIKIFKRFLIIRIIKYLMKKIQWKIIVVNKCKNYIKINIIMIKFNYKILIQKRYYHNKIKIILNKMINLILVISNKHRKSLIIPNKN